MLICLLVLLHTGHQTTNSLKSSKLVLTRINTKHKHRYINIKHKIFKELVPLVLPLLKEHVRLQNTGIMDPSVHLSVPDFFLKH